MPNTCIGDRDWYTKDENFSKRSHESGNLINTKIHLHWTFGNKKTPDLEFDIIKNIPKNYCPIKSCSELFSDRLPIIITVHSKAITKKKKLSAMPKQNNLISRSYSRILLITLFL